MKKFEVGKLYRINKLLPEHEDVFVDELRECPTWQNGVPGLTANIFELGSADIFMCVKELYQTDGHLISGYVMLGDFGLFWVWIEETYKFEKAESSDQQV